jgi:Leucine-rich repeat (LRR) protein
LCHTHNCCSHALPRATAHTCVAQLTSLPDGLGALDRLDALSVHKNCLTTLPPSISCLVNLSRLSLYENELTALPPEVGCLANLQEL